MSVAIINKQQFAVINCAAIIIIDAVAFVNAVVVLMQWQLLTMLQLRL